MPQSPSIKKAVLICDDEKEIRVLIRDAVQRVNPGIIIVEAVDGSDAFMKAGRQIFDLVITDISMPKRDGVRFVQSLALLNSDFRPKNVFIISGKVSDEDISRNGLSNVVFFPKPCDFDLLKTEIGKALQL